MTLAELKTAMRINHSRLDSDLENNINACLLDLKRAGIKIDEDISGNQLIGKAIEIYVKWQYDYDEKGERYEKAYKDLLNALALCGDYNV